MYAVGGYAGKFSGFVPCVPVVWIPSLFGSLILFEFIPQVVFFVTFAIASCYISRVIRLAVGFSPQLRRSMPWLMSVSRRLLLHARLILDAPPPRRSRLE